MVNIEGVFRRTRRNLLKEIRRENFVKRPVDLIGLMPIIGGGVPRVGLLDTLTREFSKT